MSNNMETRCVHGGSHGFKENSSALTMPIYQTAAFSHTELGHNASGFDYTRLSNPNRTHLEESVYALENAADTIAFSSGMAAISPVFELFSPGDRSVCSADLYGGTVLLFDLVEKKNGLILDFVDTTDLSLLEQAMEHGAKAIYIETPSNPMMNVTDIGGCAEFAKKHGANGLVN